jgi:hypothetical protein
LSVARRATLGPASRWSVRHATRDYVATYAAGVAMANGDVVVGFAGPVQKADLDGQQSIHVTATRDGGATWRPPLLVRGGDGRPSLKVRLVRARSALHLFWAQSTSTALLPEFIEHAWSRDGGATWTLLPAVPRIGARVHDFHVAVDVCERIHLVVNASSPTRRRFSVSTTWKGGDWARPDSLATDALVGTHSVYVATGPLGSGVVVTAIDSTQAGGARTIVWPVPRLGPSQ